MGVPEKAEGYDIKVEAAPEIWGEANTHVMRSWAHELGLTPGQAQGLAERYAGLVSQHDQKTFAETQAALSKEWGDSYGAKLDAGNRALQSFGSDEAKAALQQAGLLNNPHIVKLLVAVGEQVAPHDGAAGMTSPGGNMTAQQARAEAAKIRSDAAYWDNRDPRNKALVSRVVELEKLAADAR